MNSTVISGTPRHPTPGRASHQIPVRPEAAQDDDADDSDDSSSHDDDDDDNQGPIEKRQRIEYQVRPAEEGGPDSGGTAQEERGGR